MVTLRGVGFLPGDGCAFDGVAVPGAAVSSAVLACEAPALDPEPDRDWAYEPVIARSATPGGWDGTEMVPAGGGGVATRPARTPRSLSFAGGETRAVVSRAGGSPVAVRGEGLAARGAEETNRPQCRFRTVDITARPAPGERDVAPGPASNPRGVGGLECVSPALAVWNVAPASRDVVPFAIAASTVPGRIGAEKMPANHDVVLAPETNVPGVVGVVAAGEPAPPAGASTFALEIVAALASRDEAARAETNEGRVLASYESHADGRVGLACFVASEDVGVDVREMGTRDAIGGRFFACGARADFVGFATVRVALARRGVRVRGAPPAAIVEFEFAPSPTIRNVVTHAGLVPGRVVDVNAAFWKAADARRGFFVATTKSKDGSDADVVDATFASSRWTSADGTEGTEWDNTIVVAADADGALDEDDADVGGAWWHAGGAGAGVAPAHVLGAEFKPGEGLRVRFADGGISPEARRAILVRAHFVSSALVKVEQPATEAEVHVDVSVNGGVSFSNVAVAHREEIPP